MARRPFVLRHAFCLTGLALVAMGGGPTACVDDFDTSRATPPRGSIGREMYTVVCDRVGAQALREDITGASYHDVCHADAKGNFASVTVDATKLPPLDPNALDKDTKQPVPLEQQSKNRRHRIARIEALANRRDDLIGAFDVAFANEPVPTKDLSNADPTKSCEPGKGGDVDLRLELGDMIGRMTDLYNDDTVPHMTRALSRVMTAVDKSQEAQNALAKFDARRAYRPKETSLGVARPALSYPRLVELANALLRLLSADMDPFAKHATAKERVAGRGHAPLVSLMAAMREELRTATESPTLAPLLAQPDARDATVAHLSRPRGNLEIARTLLLHEDDAFAAGAAPRFIVRRDPRGVAQVALKDGKVPPPFVDVTGPQGKPDGLPDLDDLGRFVNHLDAPTPFRDVFAGDAKGREGRLADGRVGSYDYLNVSRTFLASFARDLVPLLEPDPRQQHETVMDLLGGFVVVAGVRDDRPTTEKEYDGTRLSYRGYHADASPLLDLVHAVGQVLGDPQADDTLALFQKLAREKPDVLARFIGVGLTIKRIADQHPEASIPEKSTLWDEVLDVVVQIAQKPKLIEDIIRAFGDDATLDLPRSAIAFTTMRDELTYDRGNLNGPVFNIMTNKVETMRTAVDRSRPDTGTNRSAFQRFLQALHDTNGMSVCTKPGAVAHIVWRGVSMDFPSFAAQAACVVLGADPPADPLPMCGMIRIKNIAEEIVNAVLGTVNLDIRDDCMKKLVSSPLTGIVGGADAFLEEVSGIKGFNTKPTVQGINRLVFFDLPYGGTSGDTRNPKTLNFLKDVFDTPPTLVCPQLPFTDKDGTTLNLRQCSTFKDTIRGRDNNSLFPIEEFGFLQASVPLARAFYQSEANLLFVNLFDALHRHWGSNKQSKEECDPGAPKTNARWCSQDGAVTYEPLIAEALKTDLFPALHEGVKELSAIKIQHCEERTVEGACTKTIEWDGVKVLAEAVKNLVDPAKSKGVAHRDGNAGVTRNDGTLNKQVTPVYLLIDALKGFDARLADHKDKNPSDDRLPGWRRARSQIVDQLFKIDGQGKSSKFANPSVAKMLPLLVATLREQISAHCPDPVRTSCKWARADLTTKMRDIVTGPTFAGLLDVLDAVRADEPARTELEKLLVFLLQSGVADAAPSTLSALADTLQVFEDDTNMTALLHAAADAAGPEEIDPKTGNVSARGLVLASIEVMARVLGEARDEKGDRICSKEVDPNRTLAVVLRHLVTPPPDGKPPPIEVILDVLADVNRRNPEDSADPDPNKRKLNPADYGSIAREVTEFCTDPSRGLEQAYTMIRQATKDL